MSYNPFEDILTPRRAEHPKPIVVGKAPDEVKDVLSRHLAMRLNAESPLGPAPYELPKTPEFIDIMRWANDSSNNILAMHGLPPIDVPPDNIRLVSQSPYGTDHQEAGAFNPDLGVITIIVTAPEKMANNLLHEMVHYKSYKTYKATHVGDMLDRTPVYQKNPHRIGLSIVETDRQFIKFTCLNEAVTEELAKNESQLLPHPSMIKARDRALEIQEKYNAYFGAGLLPGRDNDTLGATAPETDTYGTAVIVEFFNYRAARKALWMLIDKLKAHNPGRRMTPHDYFDLFAKAVLTSDMLSVGRLIDRTFGKGTFRKIAECGADTNGFIRFIDSLPAAPSENKPKELDQAA